MMGNVERRNLKEMQKYYTEQMATYLPAIRKTLNITQRQLAVKVGITRHSIIGYEHHKNVIPWNTYLALVLYFQQFEISKDFMDRFELFDSEVLTQ